MKKDELLPYLNKFITVILDDGSEHSGYVSNPDAIKKAQPDEEITVALVNGFYSEDVALSRIRFVNVSKREDTVNLPVIDLTSGYQTPETLRADELVLYNGEVDEELSNLYHQYLHRFHAHPDVREDLNFDLMNCNQFKAVLRKCLEENETVDVVTDSFVQAYNQAMKPESKESE